MHLANGGIWFFILSFFIILSALILFSYFYRKALFDQLFSRSQKDFILSNFNPLARFIRTIMLLAALLFVSFSLLDPRWGTKSLQADIEGIDVVFIMDISRSMITPDVQPDRLSNARKLSGQLMSLLLGNRIGITAFAGYAFNVVPLTTDVNAATIFLNELSPDMIDVQGTNLEDALKKALELFDKDALTHKAIVLFTDGEDYEFSPLSQVEAAKNRGISIFTVGIGTPNGGQIPLFDQRGNLVDYLKKDGKVVTSKLNDALLSKIASETHGIFVYGNDNSIITLAKKLDEIKKSRFGNNLFEFMEPQFQYFLLFGLLCLFIALLLPERRIRISAPLVLLCLLFINGNNGLYASDASKATSEYRKGKYEEALQNFQKAIIKKPDNEKLRYNEGNTLYQLQKYNEAATSYLGLTNSKDPQIRDRALFNLGNSYLDKQEAGNAIEAYRQILENGDTKNPIYRKALKNFLYAKQQQKNQNQNQQQNKNQNSSSDNKQNQDKQNQNRNKNEDEKNQANAQQKPISPSDVENLLNLIEEEEKKHLSKKERDKTIRNYPRNEW